MLDPALLARTEMALYSLISPPTATISAGVLPLPVGKMIASPLRAFPGIGIPSAPTCTQISWPANGGWVGNTCPGEKPSLVSLPERTRLASQTLSLIHI